MTTMPPATARPTASTMPTATSVPPGTGVPPTTMVLPHPSAMCQRAARCCALIARYAPMPGAAHRCERLAMARDTDCSRAIGAMAEAILQQGEEPPETCTQPGRGRGR